MIKPIINDYKSSFCKAPCGLIDTFNYKNRVGCYDTLEITQNEILNFSNFNSFVFIGIHWYSSVSIDIH